MNAALFNQEKWKEYYDVLKEGCAIKVVTNKKESK